MMRKIANTFKVLNDVVPACYSYELTVDYVAKIKTFLRAYLCLRVKLTPNAHALMHHVQGICALTGRGLGQWSKQTSKPIHHDFKQTWQRFRINDTDDEL